MLILNKRRDLRRISAFEEVKGHHLKRLHHAPDDQRRFFLAERAHQHLAGGVHAAFSDKLLRDAQLMELFNDAFPKLGIDPAHPGDFQADDVNFIRGHVLEQAAGGFRTERDHKNGGFFAVGERLRAKCHDDAFLKMMLS